MALLIFAFLILPISPSVWATEEPEEEVEEEDDQDTWVDEEDDFGDEDEDPPPVTDEERWGDGPRPGHVPDPIPLRDGWNMLPVNGFPETGPKGGPLTTSSANDYWDLPFDESPLGGDSNPDPAKPEPGKTPKPPEPINVGRGWNLLPMPDGTPVTEADLNPPDPGEAAPPSPEQPEKEPSIIKQVESVIPIA